MFKPLQLEIKTPESAYKVIKYDVVSDRDKFRFARAIIESGHVRYICALLEASERDLLSLSPTWKRRAALAVHRKGRLRDWMKCFSLLQDSSLFEKVRFELMQKIVSRSHKDWLQNDDFQKSEVSVAVYTDFWGSSFTPKEAALIVEKTLTINDIDALQELLMVSSIAHEPFLTKMQAAQIESAIHALSKCNK